MRHLALGFVCGSLALAAGCKSSSKPAPPTPPPPALAVDGARIVEAATGETVRLRGVAMTVNAWGWNPFDMAGDRPSQTLLAESDLERVHGWGANAVTVYLDWNWFQVADGWTWMDGVMDWCREHGVYAIPSLVIYPEGGPRGGPVFWSSAVAQEAVRAFWGEFARRYRGRSEIAGLDVLNEPQGNGGDLDAIAAYQAALVDAVRGQDPDRLVFIEPYYGDAGQLRKIDRAGLVYDPHYYQPFYYTGSGMPWIASNNVPLGVTYPGDMVTGANLLGGSTRAPLTTSDSGGAWQTLQLSATAPAGAETAYPALWAEAAPGGTVWFDELEWSSDGSTWSPVTNGGFEAEAKFTAFDTLSWSYRADADHWRAVACSGPSSCATPPDFGPDLSVVQRVTGVASAGSASARIGGCPYYCQYSTQDWVGTAAGIPVTPGATVHLRARARWTGMPVEGAGIELGFASAIRERWDRDRLRASLDSTIGTFSSTNQVPIFIGEFTPSLLTPHDSVTAYVDDLLGWVDDQGFGWAFYEYRNGFTPEDRCMGLYSCPDGTPTSDCNEATYVLDVLRAHLAP